MISRDVEISIAGGGDEMVPDFDYLPRSILLYLAYITRLFLASSTI